MFRLFCLIVFKLNGWKIDCDLNLINSHKKYIVIGAPHTSNWDAVYFTAAVNKLNLKTNLNRSYFGWKRPVISLSMTNQSFKKNIV